MPTLVKPAALFDRRLYRKRRERSAEKFEQHSFIFDRILMDIADRLSITNRQFPVAAFYGAAAPGKGLSAHLSESCGVGYYVNADLAHKRVRVASNAVVYDEELSALKPQSFDLIISILDLHTVNDLIGALIQIKQALKPDGLFIGSLFAENTLAQLKQALVETESTLAAGVSNRVAPFAHVKDLGMALQRAGFALPVVDIDRLSVRYANPGKLFEDLRGMGETNAMCGQGKSLRRDVFNGVVETLDQQGGEMGFDIATITGWAPHESQQKPLQPGAAKNSLEKAVLGGKDEI